MKKLFSLLIVFISVKCFGQVYQVLPQYGYEMKRVNATLVLLLPSDTTTNKTGVARIGTVLYSGNGTKWTPATATDTTSLSNRINLKLNISDTATMLTPYAKTIVVNTKVNISDTAAMLSPYAKTSVVNSGLALKVNIADTATMLTPYLKKIDTASLSNRINLKANINNATFTGTFATAAGAIGNASLANGAVANLSGTNTGDQTTITGNAGTATSLQTARTIGTTTGDATSAGSTFDGTANNTNALTLATVNSNVGTFTNSTITVNGKGLITAASSGTGVGTVTSVAALTLGTTGTDLSSTVANGTTTPVITLQVPTASATNRGALSSADWTAFNNKGSVSSVATDNATGITGGTITTTGTLAIDTIVISTRKWRQKGIDSVQANLTTGLALKVNISDTSSMLSSYFRKVDTASLSNRINLKLNISDTSSMLSPYARTNSVNAGLALKVNISDTATMLTSYLRKVDTTAMLSPYKTFYPRTAISLTTTGSSGAATYNNSTGVINVPVYTDAYSGTVTSVATNNGSGITGGTITTSGTLAIDTLLISTRAWRQKGIDSVVALIPSTTGYVPYTGATQDVDLDAFKLNAQSLHVKGTAGNGHLGLKHQSASATASANEVSLFADNLGNLSWLNGNLYLSKFITSGNTAARSYTFPNATGTIALTSDLTGYLTSVTATSPLSSSGGTTPNITIAQATTSVNGYLSSTDWTTFNGKESVLTFSSPLVRTTNTISIPVATTSVNGYLSSTDWTTFNNKQGTITLTTTGTSGAATFSANTLNIPNYGSALSGYLPLTGGTLTGALGGTSATFSGNVVLSGSDARFNGGDASGRLILSNSNTTTYIGLYGPSYATTPYLMSFVVNSAAALSIASTGAATFSGGFISIQGAQQNSLWLNQNAGGTSTGFLLGRSYGSTNSQDFFIYDVASATRVLGIASTGAATFSSSVTTNANNYFNNTGGRAFDATSDGVLMAKNGGAHNIIFGDGNVRYYSLYTPSGAAFGSIRNFSTSLDILSFTSAGNVGIGTTSPADKLEVNGNIKLSSTVGSTATPSYIWLGNDFSNGTTRDKLKIYLYNDGATERYGFTVGNISDVQYHSNGIHDFYTNNSLSVRINSSGNVGIGTASPSYLLHTKGSGSYNGTIFSDNSSTTGSGSFQVGVNGTSIGGVQASGNIFGNTDQNLSLYSAAGLGLKVFVNATATSVFTIASTGAATFSSSVTASQGNFNQIGNGFAINMTNRNNNQTWGLVVDTDAVDDKILGLQSSYGITPFFALKLEASGGAATFSSSIKTAAPSGGTAKPFKIGAAATVTPTSQNRTIEIEIDGVTYYLTAKTTND